MPFRAQLFPALLTLALWIGIVCIPAPPTPQLDQSWQEVLIRAHTAGWQFGKDIVFTFGPWGFLRSEHHLGREAAGARLAWELLGHLGVAAALVFLLRDLPAWRRSVFVAAMVGLQPLYPDGTYAVFITLAGLRGIIAGGAVWARFAWALPLGFLLHVKFSFGVMGLAAVGLAAAAAGWRREWSRAAAPVAGFAIAFLGAWLAGGQRLGHLPAYFAGAREFVRGYDMMALDEPRWLLAMGLLVGALGACAALRWMWRPWDAGRVAGGLLLGVVGLLIWRHAYTRVGPAHHAGLFTVAAQIAIALGGWRGGVATAAPGRPGLFDAVWIAAALCLLLPEIGERAPLRENPARLLGNAAALAQFPALPARWERELADARGKWALPELPALVGQAPLDVYNWDQGIALMQPVNYAPRPVFQGYAAFTPALAARNAAHYAGPRAPEFVLWRMQSLDDRFPAQDDTGLLPLIKSGYAHTHTLGDYLLLRRKPAAPAAAPPPARERIAHATLRLGETLALPLAHTVKPLWIRVRATPTALGRLRTLAYKPTALFMTTTDAVHGAREWRITLRTAHEPGFLLQPALATNADFAAFMGDQPFPPITAIRFGALPRYEKFWATVDVEVFAAPDLRNAP